MSIATAYRPVHEAIDVIAAHAPDLHEVLDQDRLFFHVGRWGWAEPVGDKSSGSN